MTFENSVIVITGGTAGIGRATARAFARTGASVAVLARDPGRLAATVLELREAGVRALALPVDVADEDRVEAAAARIEAELGPIDVWINNAMVSVFSPIARLSAAEVRRVTEVTYLGAVHGSMAALRRMLPRDRGTIVQVGSTLAYRAIPLQAPYCAAKHALKAFSESLRVELLHSGSQVRVTVVHLPAVNTPQFDWTRSHLVGRPRPLPPVFQPELAAGAIVYAAHHAPRELKVGMPVASAIWINSFIPGVIDRVLARTGYSGQEEAGVAPPRADNLFHAVEADVAAHGRFDREAKERSLAVDVRTSPRSWTAASLALAAIAGGLLASRRRRSDRSRSR